MTPTPIRLRAQDQDDLKVVSACLQDAIVPIGDMCFLPEEGRFVLVVNRFKWETAGQPRPGPTADDDDLVPFERTHCGVRIEGVTGVKVKDIDLKDRRQILELLAIEAAEGGVVLDFAGGGCIRLDAANWTCFVEDLGEPWPTTCKPCHPLEE
ncbi:DUF2948 family protein [Azospirillum canadense]|uniref:DUF2948 family protein n=1 Tax=Azospirillum canadense TaxID=403962 RepID=UPI00222606FA|nr:DUF2948 family protein [Azospirillum canadense]MCW2236554.1 hypothetical protein [Azospirillum canadense]